MAISAVAPTHAVEVRQTLGITRLAVTGGVTGGLFLVFCWLGTFLPVSSPTHAYIKLFTNADVGSARALVEGGVWALLFGALISALFAFVYNSVAALSRR
jgi:hypothetical protein